MVDLLDKVKHGIDKGVNTVSIKSKELIDITRLKNQISALEEQVKKASRELGEAVYKMYLQEELDNTKIIDKCSDIASLETQVKEKEEELKQTRQKAQEAMGKNFCSNCDGELPEHAKYCSECGQKVETKIEEIQSPEPEPVERK